MLTLADSSTTRSRPRRIVFLTAWLVGWILIEGVATVALLVPALAQPFAPTLYGRLARTYGVLAALSLVCLVALLRWKRWGFWGICLLAVASVSIGAPIHLGPEHLLASITWSAAYVAALFLMLQVGGNRRAWPHLG